MRKSCSLLAWLIGAAAWWPAAAADLTFQTPDCRATVSPEGWITSLQVGGTEWLAGRGAYFYQGQTLTLPRVERTGEQTARLAGDQASAELTFAPDKLTWRVANLTAQPLEFVMVFGPQVTHAVSEAGAVARLPANQPWPAATWYAGDRTLRITGGTRIWGPFDQGCEVWHLTLAPQQTRVIELTPGRATAADLAKLDQPAPQPITVKGDGYEATVGLDGCLTSLKVGGVELVHAAADFPRGGYFHQKGLVKLATVAQPEPGVVVADGELAAARYELGARAQTWRLTNKTAATMAYVIVFDPAIDAVVNDQGRWGKPPLERPWPVTTWFRGEANVTLSRATRVWGPWGNHQQVWQVDIPAKGEVQVSVAIHAATAEQVAKAREVAAAPPPPPPTDPVGPMWDLNRFAAPPRTWPAEGFTAEGCRAVLFEGPPYGDRPTKVFAWIGLPKVEPGRKVPGMVLVHGGGGTAFDSWVRRWTARGYAAIAMDTCGQLPRGTYSKWERNPEGGPPGWGGWGQTDEPREDQWAFHAVADALLAHSLLRSLPEVDPDRIGLTGISWGGYLTSILAGVDSRLKLAVPVYGCGFTNEHGFAGSVAALGPERGARWMRWWDPSAYLPQAKIPLLWVTGTNDFAYTFNALQKSYRLPTGPRTLCIKIRMPHGHGDAGEGPAEIFAFADSLLQGGDPLARFTNVRRDGQRVEATFESRRPIVKAELTITSDTGKWQDRRWSAQPAELADGRVTATLPAGVTVWYLNLTDDRGLVVSSEHEEIAP